MKTILSRIFIVSVAAGLLAACEKDEIKAVISSPSSVSVTVAASTTTLVLDSANAASTPAITFTWNAANYGADLAVAYTFQVDSMGGTFEHATEFTVGSALNQTFTKKSLNDLALSLGLVPDVA